MKKPKPTLGESDTHSSLLDDLEAVRALLEMPEMTPIDDDSDDVPVLEDMVDGAFTVSESTLSSRSSFDDPSAEKTAKSRLADATIQALLGDEWRVDAQKILADARSTVEDAGGTWSSNEMNALNESLKVRIDHTVDDWLVEMMNDRIEDLRARLLSILEHELIQFTRALTDEDPHGQ